MTYIDFSKSNVLSIDDLAEARFTIRTMLKDFGCHNIDNAITAEEALNLLKKGKYDVILSDYNLGKGKDGQQILEEARESKIIPHTSCFIMITAENQMDQVMGAVEFQPDGYITKPFTKAELKVRLEKILTNKLLLFPIEKALDLKKPDIAIKLCDQVALEHKQMKFRCARLKVDTLFDQEKYKEVLTNCEAVIVEKDLPWARHLKGKALFKLGEIKEAEKVFSELLEDNSLYIHAYDWLAKTQRLLNKDHEAQETLQAGLKISPKGIKRQMALGEVAQVNNDWDTVESAYRKAISIGQNSFYKTADNYLNYAKALQFKLESTNSKDSRHAKKEALRALSIAKKDSSDPKVIFSAELLEGETHFKSGEPEQARKAIVNANKMYSKVKNPELEQTLELARGLTAVGQTDEATAVLDHYEKNQLKKEEEAKLKAQIKAMRDEVQRESYNNKGVQLYKGNQLVEAYQYFCEAAIQDAASPTVLLNALQAGIEIASKDLVPRKDRNVSEDCALFISRLQEMHPTDYRYARYQKLDELYHSQFDA